MPIPPTGALARRAPRFRSVALFGLVAGSGWFVLFLVAFIGGPVSFVWWTAGAVVLAAVAALIVRRWTRGRWTPRHELALCFGAGMASALFGLLLVAVDGNPVNIVFQCAVIAAAIIGYRWMKRRYREPELQHPADFEH